MRWTDKELSDHLGKKGIDKKVAKITRRPVPQADGGMNKLEARYAREELDIRKMAGEIRGYKFESVKLRLAGRTFYTPDFEVAELDGTISFHETKGFWRDDARVKVKVAAEMYPEFSFWAIQRKKGIWIYEYFGSRSKLYLPQYATRRKLVDAGG